MTQILRPDEVARVREQIRLEGTSRYIDARLPRAIEQMLLACSGVGHKRRYRPWTERICKDHRGVWEPWLT